MQMQNLCKFLLKYIIFVKFVEFGNSKTLYVNHLSDLYQSKNTHMVEGRLGTSLKRFNGAAGEKCQHKRLLCTGSLP